MNKIPLVSVNNVSKKYCKDLKKSLWYGIKDIAKEIIGYQETKDKLRADEFWSLQNISFELSRGECIGLIGRNGAGKSTLLKMLNGLIKPDSGCIQIKGRVGALIELGAGFNPLLTGKENIYINGSVLGFKKKEIERKIDEVINFAELGDFIDSPVQNYSSGMKVRLGFAIASQMNPDIMLIDEVLAVGDFQFRQKCAQRINEIKKQSSILLVSHNMRDIKMLCTKVIMIEKGNLVYFGEPNEAISYYHKNSCSKQSFNENDFSKNHSIYGQLVHDRSIEIFYHRWIDASNNKVKSINHGEPTKLEFSFKVTKNVSNLIIGVPIWDENYNLITSFNTDANDMTIKSDGNGTITGHLFIPRMIFNPGIYKSVFVIVDNKEYLYRNLIDEFIIEENSIHFGYVTPEHQWNFDK